MFQMGWLEIRNRKIRAFYKKLIMSYVHQQVQCFYDGGVPVWSDQASVTNVYWLANTDMGHPVLILFPQLSFWDQHREIHEAPGEQGHLIGAQYDPTGQ